MIYIKIIMRPQFLILNRNHNSIIFDTKGNNYDFKLNEDVYGTGLDLGAISGTLNLENIAAKSITLNMGAGNLNIVLK